MEGLGRVLRLLCAGALLCAAQDTPVLRARVRVLRGRLAVASLSDDPSQPLLRGFAIPEAKIRRILIADLERQLQALGPIYCASFEGGACPPDTSGIGTFSGTWEAFQRAFETWRAQDPQRRVNNLAQIFKANALLFQLADISRHTALIWDDERQAVIDTRAGELQFLLAPKVRPWKLCAGECAEPGAEYIAFADAGPRFATERDLHAALDPLAGGLWRPDEIRARLLALYADDRVLKSLGEGEEPLRIEPADAREAVRSVTISEGYRITDVSAPEDDADAFKALYALLPDREFRRLGKPALVYPENARPLLTADVLAQASELARLGYTLDLLPAEDATLRSLRVRRTQDSPAEDAKAPKTEAAAPRDETAKPVQGPATGTTTERKVENSLLDRFWPEAGFSYRPGQGVRVKGRLRAATESGTLQTFTANGGGATGGALGGLDYSADFLGFGIGDWRRRLSVNAGGGSEIDAKRLLGGTPADERRWSALAGATLEVFRDRSGQWLRTFIEARRTTVILQRKDTPDEKFKLGTLDFGGLYFLDRPSLRFGRSFSLTPRLHAGVPVFAGTPSFASFALNSTFFQSLPNRMQIRVYGAFAEAGSGTPIVEQPSFGGAESVRGYRADEAIARRVWSVRNEFWIPFPAGSAAGGVPGYLREHVLLAALFDVGGAAHIATGRPGSRAGAGGGVRFKVRPRLYLKLDYAYGFSPDQGRRNGRFYFSADTDPR